MAKQKKDDQLEHTYSSYVRIRDVALKTCQKRWKIGRSGERGSGISVLAARHDDDDIFLYIFFINDRNKISLSDIKKIFLKIEFKKNFPEVIWSNLYVNVISISLNMNI